MPRTLLAALLLSLVSITGIAQTPAPAPAPLPAAVPAPPLVHSPEVSADGKITLRIFAPEAKSVTLIASDTVSLGQKLAQFTKTDGGIWEATTEPVPPGAYRYQFNIDGVPTADPRNPDVSPSNATVWSLAVVPGVEWVDRRPDVPHGTVSSVYYNSKALSRPRRMTIYTPPGYETSTQKYPVLYLLHGATDSDQSWTTVGRANFILDNLLAANKAVPMLIVMPAGHTTLDPVFLPPTPGETPRNEFVEDFLQDVVPYIESHYRVLTDQPHTAIAGLSMGGGQTIDLLMAKPQKFAYVGVFSSGIFAGMRRRPTPAPAAPGASAPPPANPIAMPATIPQEWVDAHAAVLDNPSLKPGLKLLSFSTGSGDFLLQTSKATVELLKAHGYNPIFHESGGIHSWSNWRDYLHDYLPQLFR